MMIKKIFTRQKPWFITPWFNLSGSKGQNLDNNTLWNRKGWMYLMNIIWECDYWQLHILPIVIYYYILLYRMYIHYRITIACMLDILGQLIWLCLTSRSQEIELDLNDITLIPSGYYVPGYHSPPGYLSDTTQILPEITCGYHPTLTWKPYLGGNN